MTTTAERCDVAVVGGGPSGAAAAIALRRVGLDTVLVEASGYEAPRPGETLTPEVRPVLARLGLRPPAGSIGAHTMRSAWGAPELTTWPAMLGPYGDGTHVDRAGFDAALADGAEAAGATVLRGSRVTACTQAGAGWSLTAGGTTLTAAAVVCATGRGAGLARDLGARWLATDRLVGVAAAYATPDGAGTTLVEAAPDGWWYSAALPGGRRIVVLMTDADLCRHGRFTDQDRWTDAVDRTTHTAALLRGRPLDRPRVASAVSRRLRRTGPGRWLATGDAAMSVDPLTGRGVLHALLAGEAAGTAMAHWLLGNQRPATDYEAWLDRRFDEYLTARAAIYGREQRWPDAPFWRRRQPRSDGNRGRIS